jgi:hypothetical protein
VGTLPVPGEPVDLVAAGPYLYVTAGYSGLQVIDISNAESPRIVGSVDTPDCASGIELVGNHGYVAAGMAGLLVIDVSVPEQPVIISSTVLPDSVFVLAIRGAYAFVGGGPGIHVVDISEPEAPRVAGWVSPPVHVEGIAFAGSYAYVATTQGLHVLDVSNPECPRLIGCDANFGASVTLAASEDYVYLAAGRQGIQVLSTQCETTAVFLSNFALETEPGAVQLRWEHAPSSLPVSFRLEGSKGEQVWDVDPEPTGPEAYAAVDRSAAVRAGGRILYNLFGREGDEDWQLLRSESVFVEAAPLVTALIGAFPNPFNPATSIQFSLAEAGPARVAIYDLAGRLVAQLAESRFEAGPQAVIWRGEDEAGRPVSSGVYFCRLEAPGFAASRKLVLLR